MELSAHVDRVVAPICSHDQIGYPGQKPWGEDVFCTARSFCDEGQEGAHLGGASGVGAGGGSAVEQHVGRLRTHFGGAAGVRHPVIHAVPLPLCTPPATRPHFRPVRSGQSNHQSGTGSVLILMCSPLFVRVCSSYRILLACSCFCTLLTALAASVAEKPVANELALSEWTWRSGWHI